jgi:hypothetical protein
MPDLQVRNPFLDAVAVPLAEKNGVKAADDRSKDIPVRSSSKDSAITAIEEMRNQSGNSTTAHS